MCMSAVVWFILSFEILSFESGVDYRHHGRRFLQYGCSICPRTRERERERATYGTRGSETSKCLKKDVDSYLGHIPMVEA